MHCQNCGTIMSDSGITCPKCAHPNNPKDAGISMMTRVTGKSKVVFVLLALLLGGLGIHRMYLEDWGLGLIYLLFCWTGIPVVIALFEAIVIGFRSNDSRFAKRY